MAQTKVKLVSSGVITVDNLHTNHGITTDHIGEGSVLYYTDARVQSYLTSNNYIKTTDVASLETLTSISLSANTLSYVDEAGNTTNLDLSLYLDDTNLARLVSGTLDGGTGIATFTRDDASTFTVDFSAFLSDANDYVTSAAFNTSDGILTLTRLGGGTVTVDLDNRYLTSFTETDPIYTASSWYTTTNNSSNWDTAFGWGDHSLVGYLTAETDPIFSASAAAGITSTNITNWNTAYGWGNHASAGYLTSFTETDPVFTASAASGITSTNISNWNTAYGWGNHASAGYQSASTAITTSNIGSQSVNYAASSGLATDLNAADSTQINFNNVINTDYSTMTFMSRAWQDVQGTNGLAYNFTTHTNAGAGGYGALQIYYGEGGYVYSPTSFRTPIFYDSNDTNYYIDPNGITNISHLRINGNWSAYGSPYTAAFTIRGSYPSAQYRSTTSNSMWLYHMDGAGHIQHYYAPGVDTQDWNIKHTMQNDGTFISTSSSRAPIFYDSNDTTYYGDFAGTSWLRHLSVGDVNASNDGSWNARLNLTGSYHARLDVKSNSDGIITTIYSHTGQGVGKVGTMSNHPLAFMVNGGTAGYAYANYLQGVDSVRAPIFYDSNNTGYYVDPASTSNLNYTNGVEFKFSTSSNNGRFNAVGDWGTRFYTDTGYIWFGPANSGHAHIYTDRPNFYFNVPLVVAGGSTINSGDVRSPIFYDSDNTGYYIDPNGTSNIVNLSLAGKIRNNDSVSVDDGFGIYFSSDYSTAYAIYREGGAWSHPYPDLRIAFHTGIKLGANAGYNGVRFYSDYDMSTIVASINDGDSNLRGYYDIIAYASDKRLKEKIEPITNAIDKVKKLNGFTYNWNNVGEQYGWEPPKERESGVFAQEVQEVLPEAVRTAPFDQDHDGNGNMHSKSGENFLTVKYEKLVPLLIEAIKEQQQQIEELKQLINK